MTVQNPPIFVQEGSHPAEDTRRALEALAAGTSGYSSATALAVTERASLTNMSVDIAGGGVWVPGTESTFQGSYFCDNRGTTNVTIAAADATNPRIDLVVAKVEDSEYSGAVDQWSLAVVTGTPALSPTIPSAPANSVVLATVAVASLATTITNSDINDMRDLSQTTHGDVSIPGDLVVNGDVTATSDLTVVGDINATGDVRVAGNPVGMVLVKTYTVPAGNHSSVTVTDAFSSEFDNYLITDNGGTQSSDTALMFFFGSSQTGSDYYQSLSYIPFTTGTPTGIGHSLRSEWVYCGGSSGIRNVHMTVMNPGVANYKNMQAVVRYGTIYGTATGYYSAATAFTSFTLKPASGTMSGGTIRVYGYNKG